MEEKIQGKNGPRQNKLSAGSGPASVHTAESRVRDGEIPETLKIAHEESDQNTVVKRQREVRLEPQTQRIKVSGEGDPGVRPEEEQTSSGDGAPRARRPVWYFKNSEGKGKAQVGHKK